MFDCNCSDGTVVIETGVSIYKGFYGNHQQLGRKAVAVLIKMETL